MGDPRNRTVDRQSLKESSAAGFYEDLFVSMVILVPNVVRPIDLAVSMYYMYAITKEMYISAFIGCLDIR